jgi:hypothetical protein
MATHVIAGVSALWFLLLRSWTNIEYQENQRQTRMMMMVSVAAGAVRLPELTEIASKTS